LRKAVRVADCIEIDIRRSKDGVLVLSHDSEVRLHTNGKGRIHDLSLKELQKLDAAYHFSPDNGKTFPLRNKGHTIPTLEEVIDEFNTEKYPELLFYLDIKQDGIIEDVLDMLKKKKKCQSKSRKRRRNFIEIISNFIRCGGRHL